MGLWDCRTVILWNCGFIKWLCGGILVLIWSLLWGTSINNVGRFVKRIYEV